HTRFSRDWSSDVCSSDLKASGDEKLALLEQLAKKWDDLAKYAPQGFIYEEMAKISPKFEYWLKAGDAYRSAYTNLQDTAMAAERSEERRVGKEGSWRCGR